MDAVFNMCCGLCRKQGGYDTIPYADVAPAAAAPSPASMTSAAASSDYSQFYSSESTALLSQTATDAAPPAAAATPALAPAPVAVAEPEPAAAAALLIAASSVAVGEKVTVLALVECEAAVLGAGMKFNPPRKKRCGTSGVVESIDGIKVKVTFEDEAIDPSTGAVLRVDKANMLFPLSALANDPSAPAAPEPAAVEAVEPEPAAVIGGDAGLGPAFTRGEMEPPAGEKAMGSATMGVYTAEQQARLGVDEAGSKVEEPTPAAAPPPTLAAEPAPEPAMLGSGGSGLGPAFTRGEMEPPAGEKVMGGATMGVYTAEQQARLGVDEGGIKVEEPAPAAAAVAPALSDDLDEI